MQNRLKHSSYCFCDKSNINQICTFERKKKRYQQLSFNENAWKARLTKAFD